MSESVPNDGGGLAARTVAQVREGLAQRETACVAQVLEVIQQLSGKADRLSVQELADIIGRDLTTVAKIMRAANCLGYNPGAVEVTTLPQAIGVIGFETIRNLVVSLLLIETAEKRAGRNPAHDVAGTALGSALIAQAVAERVEGLNAEQAFVSGALRHYGRLLLSTFLPDEYLDALEMAGDESSDTGCRRVFGLTPLELGQRILADANLPRLLQHTLEPARAEMIRSKKLGETEKLIVVSEFAARLAEMLADPEVTSRGFQTECESMLKQFAPSLSLDDEMLGEILAKASRFMSSVGQVQGLEPFESRIVRRLGSLAEGRAWAASGAEGRAVSPAGATVVAEDAKTVDPFASGLIEVERLVHASPVAVGRVFSAAARCVKHGLNLHSCVIFLQAPNGPLFAAEYGCGPLFHVIRREPLVNPAHQDVFTVCLSRGEDVLIRDPDEASIARFIPGWLRTSPAKGPLALFPVKDMGGTFALVCGVTGKSQRIELTSARLQSLKKLRGYLGLLRESIDVSGKAA